MLVINSEDIRYIVRYICGSGEALPMYILSHRTLEILMRSHVFSLGFPASSRASFISITSQ